MLSFDTTNQELSVMIYHNSDNLFEKHTATPFKQAEMLLPYIQDLLIESGLSMPDLHTLVVTTGPGSFTGVRIGLSAAKGIKLATGIRVLGVTLLEVLAYAIKGNNEDNITIVKNALYDTVYYQEFDFNIRPLSKAKVIKKTDVFIKDGSVYTDCINDIKLQDSVKIYNTLSKTIAHNACLLANYKIQKNIEFHDDKPFYLRSLNIQKKQKKII